MSFIKERQTLFKMERGRRLVYQEMISLGFLKNCLFVLILILLAPGICLAEDIYVAQNSAGTSNGMDKADPHAVSWFNSAANWANPKQSGKIGPGDTVHLCGTISSELFVQGNGSPGSYITILFEDGAKISLPATTCMNISSKAFIAVDGGTNGIIENTDNGTDLGNQAVTSGIIISGSHDLKITNLIIRNLYVHTSASDNGPDLTLCGGVYANGFGSNITISNCSFNNMCWCLTLFGSDGAQNLTISNNRFTNYDHGVAGIGYAGHTISNVTISDNDFGSTVVWDTTSNKWHHDGIHTFFGAGGALINVTISGNLFHGNWGMNNTAQIFAEQNFSDSSITNATTGWRVFNNVHIGYPGNLLNNGMAVLKGDGMIVANNTYLGAGVNNSLNVKVKGNGITFENNVMSGATQFVNASTATFSTLNNNRYAAVVGNGSHFSYSGSNYSSLSAWQAATGADSNSKQVSSAGLDSNGKPLSGSTVIGSGANLTYLKIKTLDSDKANVVRPSSGAWDIGAYEYMGGGEPPLPPSLQIIPGS